MALSFMACSGAVFSFAVQFPTVTVTFMWKIWRGQNILSQFTPSFMPRHLKPELFCGIVAEEKSLRILRKLWIYNTFSHHIFMKLWFKIKRQWSQDFDSRWIEEFWSIQMDRNNQDIKRNLIPSPTGFFEGWCHMWCQTCLDVFWFRIVFSREDSLYMQRLCTVTADYFAHLVFCWKCMYFQQKGKWNFCCCILITSDALLIYTLSAWTRRRDLTCHCLFKL